MRSPLQTDNMNKKRHERSTRIVLLGVAVGSRNQGVQALGASLVNLCSASANRVEVRLLAGHSAPTTACYQVADGCIEVPVVNFRLSPRSCLRQHLAWIVLMAVTYRCLPIRGIRKRISRSTPWIEALESCDLAGDVRGGDSFSDIYGMQRFIIGFLAAWTAVLVKGSLVQFPQTYGPFKNPLARWMAGFLLRRSAVVVARDKASRQVAQDLVGPGKNVLLSPDAAFSLMAAPLAKVSVHPPTDTAPKGEVVGLNVNGLMYHGGYTRNNMFGLRMDYPVFLNRLLTALLEEQAHDVWLVPHTYGATGDVESDPEASRELRRSLPEALRSRVRIVDGEYDQHEVKGVIGTCGFFIGSRMHSCIAALSQGVPCVGVAYSMKFRGVFESVGMKDWVVDGREIDDETAVRRVMELYRTRDEIRDELKANADAARERLGEVFSEMLRSARSRQVDCN